MIQNPILRGYNPDPSFCRVGEDYYVATSTNHWYPGIQIHHSRDLVNWRLVSRPLRRAVQLDIRGNPDDCGAWAPALSHADGKFWLVYTDVKRYDGTFTDAHNYIVTCETIDGEWSDPVYVNSTGFDPSLFHDDDGRKWIINMRWNHRGPGTGCNPVHSGFNGIMLQEWSPERGLLGSDELIFTGTSRGVTEGPSLFKRGEWYYLSVAEGGTGYDHAVTMARSRTIRGPYEMHPRRHIITTAHVPDYPIQKAGHGQYVEGHDGRHWHTFLMSRPYWVAGRPYSPLGRETGLAEVVWDDGWLYLKTGGQVPPETIPAEARREPDGPVEHVFRAGPLPQEFQWLRHPHPERLFRLGERGLTLIARESPGSWFEQSLVARRQEHHAYEAECTLEFDPLTYQHGAGLTTYYNRYKFHALVLTDEPGVGRALTILTSPGYWPTAGLLFPAEAVRVPPGPIDLRVVVDHAAQQFFWRQDGDWQPVGPVLDATIITDEGGLGGHVSFSGAFVGMLAYDMTSNAREAHFRSFRYAPS